MKLFTILSTVLAAAVASVASPDSDFDLSSSTTISIQAIGSSSSPVTLASIRYDPSTLVAEIDSFEAPEISPDSNLVRLGVYSPSSKSWATSTTVTSSESFAQGYVPIFVLSLDANGDVLSVSVKSGLADAGQTRDFGPKVKVVKMAKGKTPELNRPVVLSPEGKLKEEEPEKTLLQKYWWVGLGLVMLVMIAITSCNPHNPFQHEVN
jgi:hypothetical protein